MIIDLFLTGILKGYFLHILCHHIRLFLSFYMIIRLRLSIEETDLLLLLGTSVAVSIFTLMAGENNKTKKDKFILHSLVFSQY